MKKSFLKLNNILLWVLCSILVTACTEFLEPSIEKDNVTLLAPGDKIVSPNYTQTFKWEPVEHALKYRLQIVTPDFDAIEEYVLDTLISDTKYTISLAPGNYEWRVRGENGSTQTSYVKRTLNIAYSSIKQQSVRLLAPSNGFQTNQKDLSFKWEQLYGATKYRFQVDSNNFADESKIMYEVVIPSNEQTFTFLKERAFQWRVRAENDTAQSKWSTIYGVIFDKTPPAIPVLQSPADNQSVSLPAILQWNAVAGAEKYKLYVYKADSTTLYSSSFPTVTSTTSFSFNLGTVGEKIYWKVAAIDKAGNESALSKFRKFIVSQ
ncbi:fibronectin type III domain-containing protein [Solitalea canadensis]|uniref:Fibronectin type-III domain-containing protein n=1 Tax=Solitalea canadensis (strain ATCC 29591 / DSM 3403 / JCM 21819 / LMG 8368 / NBRC 15130 / NCIMB 12057 / USAM 9D) TaxID=929556 RepID=H8KTT5_SOLCM|nr:hypothetical protein [Solitalea canadensis]AFD06660.1 hypothetical protein Solca_1593 [Solitalea canadensis DSM 3403]